MTAEKKQRPRRIGPKVRRAIDLLAAGKAKNITDAAALAKMSREHLSRELRKQHVALAFEARTRELLASGMLRASVRLLELIDGPSAHVAFDASKHVLAISNIKPPDQLAPMFNLNIAPGYIIDMRDPREVTMGDEDRRAMLTSRGLIEAQALSSPRLKPDGD